MAQLYPIGVDRLKNEPPNAPVFLIPDPPSSIPNLPVARCYKVNGRIKLMIKPKTNKPPASLLWWKAAATYHSGQTG
jgi:hypothetical protein